MNSRRFVTATNSPISAFRSDFLTIEPAALQTSSILLKKLSFTGSAFSLQRSALHFPLKIKMARITVEDCLKTIPNRFQMVLVAAYRARQLSQGYAPKIDAKDKPGVIALREIADGLIGTDMLKNVR